MDNLLEMQDITKVYPNGVLANDRVNFSVRPGEIHALVGENGAGKTTLMKVLFGLEKPDDGAIVHKGERMTVSSSHQAIARGIGMVHQHFMLVPSLTVAENVMLGMEPKKGVLFDRKAAIEATDKLAKSYGLPVAPDARIRDIPVGMRQKVEILKALVRGAELLVLDEPTAVLTPQETKELFAALLRLRDQGHTIIFISHKLREVKELSDRVTVMRQGRVVGVANTRDLEEADISRMMVGRDVLLKVDKPSATPGSPVLEVKGLRYVSDIGKEVLKGVSFQVRAGEVLSIAGVEGNGQRELVEILTGLRKASSGSVSVQGADVTNTDCRRVRNAGVAHIPEDRMTHGVAAGGTIEENLISDRYHKKELNRGLLMNARKVADLAKSLVQEFDVRAQSPKTQVKMLSGGNIQKVVVAREFSSEPSVIIANQPTRGIDVGATEFIHRKLVDYRTKGTAVLLISADLNEVMSLADRLLVMFNGQIVAEFPNAAEITEEELGLYMLGLKRQKGGVRE